MQSQSEPVSVTNADLDDDGDADLITTNQLDASVSVFLNSGDGTYGAAQNIIVPPPAGTTTPPRPMGIVHADFDRNGDDSFVYRASDGNGGTDTATVEISVANVNDNCTIRGTSGNDTLIGTPGFDVICGGAGNDTIRAGGANDILIGGLGNDNLRGEIGADKFLAGSGNDNLNGRDGRKGDSLNGRAGRDRCSRDPGDKVTSCP